MTITAADLQNLPQNPDTAVAEAGKDTLLSILTALDGRRLLQRRCIFSIPDLL